MQSRIIDRNGRLGRKPGDDPFGPIGKDTWLRMSEEKTTQNFSGPRDDRDRKIAPNGQMTFWHALVRRVFAITGIGQNVIRAHRRASTESRLKDSGVARHREFGEGFPRYARQS